MARKIKLIFKYSPSNTVRFSKAILIASVVISFTSRQKDIGAIFFMSIWGIIMFSIFIPSALKSMRSAGSEYKVYNTGFEFPNPGFFIDSRTYANYKDVKEIKQINHHLVIELKTGKTYKISLKRVAYVGKLSFAEELMFLKDQYRNKRNERSRVTRRNRQVKRRAKQKKQAA